MLFKSWDGILLASHAFQYALGAKAGTKSDMLQILMRGG